MDKCPKKDCHEPNALIFRKIVIPASVDDDSVNPPKNGAYCNALVYYEATGNSYIYSSDGIPTKVSTSLNDINKMIDEAVGEEAEERKEEDQKIWDEIEVIEAGSDVVDVVGTYAELQQYDTSKLLDGDIIKVLQDETRDGAITYYRWSTSTSSFTYVGSEGPYYTESQVDTLLGGKQDTLIAGSNIQIAADGKTISATDTTYTHFTGATASADGTQGLVPGPLAGDQDKVLKGDGTWGTIQSAANTIFYMNASETGATRHLYKASNMTGLVTMQDIIDANEDGQVIVRISTSVDPSTYSDMYLQNAYVATGDYQMIFLDNQYYYSFDSTQTSDSTFQFAKSEVQRKLTAGTNIQINGNTISATDTTYSDFTGASSLADGAHGLVPAPLIGDEDKYLKGDGTWGTVQAGSNTTVIYRKDVLVQGNYVFDGFYADQSFTEHLSGQDIYDLFQTSRIIVLYRSTEDVYGEMIDAHIGDGSYSFFDVSMVPNDDYTSYNLYRYQIDTDGDDTTNDIEHWFAVQPRLTAGANISIGTVGSTPNTISVTGMPVLYGSQGQNTDGAVTQKVFTDTVGDIESILQTLNSGSGV